MRGFFCSGVSVTVAANEPPKIFTPLIRPYTHRCAATAPLILETNTHRPLNPKFLLGSRTQAAKLGKIAP